MEKSLTILKIVLLFILIIIIGGLLIFFINNDFEFKSAPKESLIYNKNIKEDFNKININSDNMDIKFVKSEKDISNVKIYDNKNNKTVVNVNNNTLNITSSSKVKCYFCFKKREIVISLPKKMYDLTTITKSGDITSKIDFNRVKINTSSGDIKLSNVKESNIKIKSGDVLINKANNFKVKSTSGDAVINKIKEYTNIETESGDIIIKDLSLIKNSKIKVSSGDVKILKSIDNIYYDTKAISGDVKINNNNRYANIELKINTKSGDIFVKN